MGCTQREAVIILYLWTAMFALPTVVAGFEPLWVALLLALATGGISLYLIQKTRMNRRMERVEVSSYL